MIILISSNATSEILLIIYYKFMTMKRKNKRLKIINIDAKKWQIYIRTE